MCLTNSPSEIMGGGVFKAPSSVLDFLKLMLTAQQIGDLEEKLQCYRKILKCSKDFLEEMKDLEVREHANYDAYKQAQTLKINSEEEKIVKIVDKIVELDPNWQDVLIKK